MATAAYDAESVTPANADVHNLFLRGVPSEAAAQVQFDSSQPDSAYVYSAVGHALVMALSEAASRRPIDPIEFVAMRLLNYRQTSQHCQQRDAEVDEYRQQRIRQLAEEARQRAIEEELQLQREHEERRKREELERMRISVPLETFTLPPKRQDRSKTGATPLHTAVKASCDVETFLRLLHDGHSFCARDAQGMNIRDAATASKNDAVVKEIDNMVLKWIREEQLDYLRWLVAADYGNSFPNLKKAFGPKLKGLPESSHNLIDAIPQWESRYRELWKLSARGTKEHLAAHCRQLNEQQFHEDVFSRTREGLSALHVALLCKNLEAVRYLVGEHPDLLIMADNFGRLPIHYAYAAGQNFVDVVRSGQASPTEPVDAFGFAPAIYAKRYELLPEPPNYGSPELLVTGDTADAADGEETASPEAAQEGLTAEAAGDREDSDPNKLTPINEDEGED